MGKHEITRRGMLFSSALTLLSANMLNSIAEAKKLPKENTEQHEQYMRLAIEASKKAPKAPFGAVIVSLSTNKIIATGCNRTRDKNPIWHGEMVAINNCPDTDTGFDWGDACLYTTAEPCPMCMSAIIWTGMPLVIYGSSMPFLESHGIGQKINIRAQEIIAASAYKGKLQLIGGVLENECNQLFINSQKN